MFKLASQIVSRGALPERDAVGWVVRLCLALEVLHRVGAAHGRISAKAIQVLSSKAYAGGFFLDGVDLADELGYQSPERLEGGAASPEDDTWALGVLLYYALTGAMPFTGKSARELANQIRKFRPPPLGRLGLNRLELQQVLDQVLCPDRARRLLKTAELRRRLVACEPSCADLSVLKLGKPELAVFDDEATDSDGIKLTDVVPASRFEREILAIQARRAAQARLSDDVEPSGEWVAPSIDSEETIEQATKRQRRSASPPVAATLDDLPAVRVGPRGEPLTPASWPRATGSSDDVHIEVSYEPVESWPPELQGADLSGRPSTPPPSPSQFPPPFSLADEPSPGRPSTAPPSALSYHAPLLSLTDSEVFAVPKQRSVWSSVAGAALFLAIGGLGAYAWLSPSEDAGTGGSDTTWLTPPASASADAGSVKPVGTVTTTPSGTATASRAIDLPACVTAFFPKGTFVTRKPQLDFVCTEPDARKAAKAMNVQLVVGARPGVVSPGMRDWSQLAWYELGLVAAVRARCCGAQTPWRTRTGADGCELDATLARLGKAAAGATADFEAAIKAFGRAATCLVREGGAGTYGARGLPGRASTAAFRRLVARQAAGTK